MHNNSEKDRGVNLWLDLRNDIETMLEAGKPADHLAILEDIYDAYINSEWADDRLARQKAHVEVGIFKDILLTLQRHAVHTPAILANVPL